ncbi:MAG: glutamine synthetase III [Clostridiales bacterium]|nr:glutamine synthetase III [Clostridiales bacterium]
MPALPFGFASAVFGDDAMKSYLPETIYNAVKMNVDRGIPISPDMANVVASAMKEWAIQNGATCYCHLFAQMTGDVAEKHNVFMRPDKNGVAIADFSGRELLCSEADASALPSGNLCSVSSARGYTSWDASLPAFIKDGVLYIPATFFSQRGEVLDERTPLLRSMRALDTQAMRILKLLGINACKVVATVGAEQEYFLIDKADFYAREDLVLCGRTLFGAPSPKAYKTGEYYFRPISERVKRFTDELDTELCKLGIYVEAGHAEAAPMQYELTCRYTDSNTAAFQNLLLTELLKATAKKHGFICLLHEKPFAKISGSGKHNNFSLCTDTGINLFEIGTAPLEEKRFSLFMCAVIEAVDEYGDLIFAAASSRGNDLRLGASEAPPSVMSVYIGDEVLDLLCRNAESGTQNAAAHEKEITSDRNRTSPVAFNKNKFELRFPGASSSVAQINAVFCTAVAETLSKYADILENSSDFALEISKIIKNTLDKHGRVIFNGDGYSQKWASEAKSRGLANLKSTPECTACMLRPKNIALFEKFGILSEKEIRARYVARLENYICTVKTEALTMLDMLRKQILPLMSAYSANLAQNAAARKQIRESCVIAYEENAISALSSASCLALVLADEIESAVSAAEEIADALRRAEYYRDNVLPPMNELRGTVDSVELYMADKYLPYPSYYEILYKKTP